MKVLTILGARPQFIKASMVSREISRRPELEEIIIHTGQHFHENMSEIFFNQMGIKEPKYNLNINSLSHGAMTGRMLEKIETVLKDEHPDWGLVDAGVNRIYGADRNSILENYRNIVEKKYPTDQKAIYGDGNAAEMIVNTLMVYSS